MKLHQLLPAIFAAGALWAGAARADVFEFSFRSTGATNVFAEFNATPTAVRDEYMITSFNFPSFVFSSATTPYSMAISGTSNYGGTSTYAGISNMFLYDSGSFNIGVSGFSFETAAGSFNVKPSTFTPSGTVYRLTSTVRGAVSDGTFYLSRVAVLGTPGPIAGAGVVPLLALVGAHLFGRKRFPA